MQVMENPISSRMTKGRSILDVIGLNSLSQAKKETLIQMSILSVACILGLNFLEQLLGSFLKHSAVLTYF